VSTVLAETALAATRDPELRETVAEILAGPRAQLATWLDARGVPTPEDTAAVLLAAVHGLLTQGSPAPSGAAAGPVLARVLVSPYRTDTVY
jgi:hypothetical protein